MAIKELPGYIGKLLVCGIAFFVGMTFGGALAASIGLEAPTLPSGAETNGVILGALLTAPILALALALLAQGLTGGLLARALMLSFLTWIAYTVNTQLDASLYIANYSGLWFSLVVYLVASLLCGLAIARLFPPAERGKAFIVAWKSFFDQRVGAEWLRRLALAVVAFMPIYYVFGLLVFPFTGEHYLQNEFGLKAAGLDQIIPILFIRSVLFLIACMPIIIAWQRSRRALFLRLGFALFTLVGLVYMLTAYWLPLSVRVPHLLEMLADEFVYAGVLVTLLSRGRARFAQGDLQAG